MSCSWRGEGRTLDRMFLLRPDDFVTRVFWFCLAYAAAQCNVLVHGFVCLSDHYHLVVTDPNGVLPVFMERLNTLLARALNAYRGRWECFFSPGSYSAVRLETPADVLDKLIYVLANPVSAGLVEHGAEWAGATSVGWRFGERREFERPGGRFFDAGGCLPERVGLTLAPLPGYDELPAGGLDELVRERLMARETEVREGFRVAGRLFLGMDGVMRFDPSDRPRTFEPRRGINPRVAARGRDERLGAIGRWVGFLREYREAWRRWRGGDHGAMFPFGTWLMRVRHRAACQPAPS
ncbi:MAG: hypothetical protein HY905_01130 [Deltaproteobacteria bacterium]|nr:hypothetical protein [Deltaproteobacteria bacterium]